MVPKVIRAYATETRCGTCGVTSLVKQGVSMTKMPEIPDFLKEDPDFETIRAELDPLVNGFYMLAKMDRRYIHFKSGLDDWNKRLVETMPTLGTVDSIQRLTVPLIQKERSEGDHRLLAVTGLFRYLGLIESIGTQFVDLLVLLLVANGYDFHVERQHGVPRIVHATSLEDLRDANLGPKVRFLKRCRLKKSSKIVDVDLRNSIAHLDFKINTNGTISAKSQGKRKNGINILQKINEFNRRITMLFFIFNEIQTHVFKPEKRLLMRTREKSGDSAGNKAG